MQADLLAAKASVDWAVSNFPSLQERLDAWLDNNVYVEFVDHEPDGPDYVVVAREKEPLPLSFSVEVGAYINAIRSSLDVLAVALAARHGVSGKDLYDIYFPIVRDEATFLRGGYKGHKLIKAIPPKEAAKIETLKPYQGGNNLLWALHDLDITRKHMRLLDVSRNSGVFNIWAFGLNDHWKAVASGFVDGPDESVFGFWSKSAPQQPEVRYTPYIALNEFGPLGRQPTVRALNNLAGLADSIIRLFD